MVVGSWVLGRFPERQTDGGGHREIVKMVNVQLLPHPPDLRQRPGGPFLPPTDLLLLADQSRLARFVQGLNIFT